MIYKLYDYAEHLKDEIFSRGLERLGYTIGILSHGEGNEAIYDVDGKDLPTVAEIYKAAQKITPEDREIKKSEIKAAYDRELAKRYSPTEISLIMNLVGYTEDDRQGLIRFVNELNQRLETKYKQIESVKTYDDLLRIKWE